MTPTLNLQGQDLNAKKAGMKHAVEALADRVLSGSDDVFADFLRLDRLLYHYSLTNTCLIICQAPEARRVSSMARFDKLAKGQGHKATKGPRDKYPSAVAPKKGSRAIWIWVPCPFSKDVDKGDGTSEKVSGLFFKPGPVWTVEDLYFRDTGEDCAADPNFLPDFVQDHGGKAGEYHEVLKEWAEGEGIKVEVVAASRLGGAAGVSYGGRIAERMGDTAGKRFSVLVHEVAHEVLHKKDERQSLSKTVRECEAEAVCGVVCEYFGFAQADLSAAYLRNHGATRQDVLASMDRIHKTATLIIDAVEKGEVAEAEAEREAVVVSG